MSGLGFNKVIKAPPWMATHEQKVSTNRSTKIFSNNYKEVLEWCGKRTINKNLNVCYLSIFSISIYSLPPLLPHLYFLETPLVKYYFLRVSIYKAAENPNILHPQRLNCGLSEMPVRSHETVCSQLFLKILYLLGSAKSD